MSSKASKAKLNDQTNAINQSAVPNLPLQFLLAGALSLVATQAPAAQAQQRAYDTFSVNTAPPPDKRPAPVPAARNAKPGNASNPSASAKTVPITTGTQWFNQFDHLAQKYTPSLADKVILQRPLLKQAERVAQWTAAANRVSKNYLTLANSLKAMPVPPNLKDLKEFRDLASDWYRDSADVLQDMVRPREPAKTIEELQDQLKEVKNRSENLATTVTALKEMSQSLRKQYQAPSEGAPLSALFQQGSTK
jgi:hypothetical protein